VTEYFCIERENGEHGIFTFCGIPVDRTANGKSPCMVSSLDFTVKFIEIPNSGSRYLGEILRYKIRSLYPGDPDDTAMDYQPIRKRRMRYAAVFVVPEETLSEYRKISCGGPLYHAFSIIKRVAGLYKGRTCVFLFLHYSWIEAAVYEEGVFTLSYTVGRSKNLPGDLVRVDSLLPGYLSRAQRVCLYHERGDEHLRPELQKYAAKGGFDLFMETIEPHLSRIYRGRPWIFSREHTGRTILGKVSIPLLVLTELLLVCVLFNRETSHQAILLEEIQLFQAETGDRNGYLRHLAEEIHEAEDELQRLKDRRPIDLYFLLAELASLLEGKAIVTELTLEGGALRVHGLSSNALSLLPRFSGSRVFSDYEIIQVVSDDKTGKERFILHATVQSRHNTEQ